MIVIERLKKFGKKYYFQLFLFRFFVVFILSLLLLFIFSFFEYNFWFNSDVRKFLFFTYVFLVTILFLFFLLKPIFHLFKIYLNPNYDHLVWLVSRVYPDIKDLLFNLVYIHYKKYVSISADLLSKSIKERTERLSFYKIEDIVSIKKIILLVFSLTILTIFTSLLTFLFPRSYIDSIERLLHYNIEYVEPFPYDIVFLNDFFEAPAYTNYELKFKIEGNNIPDEVFILYQNQMHPVFSKDQIYVFSFHLKDQNVTFQIQVGKHVSQPYQIYVLSRPQIFQSFVHFVFPSYLKKKPESFVNMFEFTVPRGTVAKITFYAKQTDRLVYKYNNQNIIKKFSHNLATADLQLLEHNTFVFYLHNDRTKLYDSISFTFQVLPDLNPVIEVNQKIDSLEFWKRFFNIRISDDYGLSKLTFHVSSSIDTFYQIPIREDYIEQEISTYFDFSPFLSREMGKTVTYYFKVCDNDPFYRGKCVKSQVFQLDVPSYQEIENLNQQITSQISNSLSNQIYQPDQFNLRIDKLIEELLNAKSMDWQQKQKLNKLFEEEKKFQNNIENIYNQFQQMMNLNNVFSQDQPFENLQKLLEQIKDNDLQKILEDLQRLLEDNKHDQLRNKLQDLKEENQLLKDMLEQLNQLYKETYVQENLQNIQNQLKELSKKQEELSQEKTKNELEKQKAIEEEFKNILQKMDSVLKYNKEIENPYKLDSIYQDMKNLENELENLSRDMNSKNPSTINQRQKKTAEELNELSDKIEKAINEQLEEQQAEDEETLIQILKYLVKVSFDQERIFKNLNTIKSTEPAYYEVIKQQRLIDDHLQTVTDSLNALAKRNPLIDKKIREEIYALNTNRKNVLNFLNQRNIPLVMRDQQFIMMRVNNLALMLAEILKQMQEQNQNNMNASIKIKSSCKKSGKNPQNKPQPNPSTVRKLQEELNKQIQQLREQIKNGQPKDKMNEQFARLSLQQELIRKTLQQYLENLKGQGEKNTQQIQKIIEDMEKNEIDLINKQLNEQTMLRLQEIMVKLLESEKAELQRELDPNRVSQTAKNINNSNPFSKIEYKEIKKQMYEHMKTIPFQFNSFYRQKIGEYYQKYGK